MARRPAAGSSLDPLSLPKETTLRVLLVVMVVVAATLAVAESTWYGVHGSDDTARVQRCAASEDPARCRQPGEQRRVLWTVAWVPVVLGVAVAGAAGGSAWRRRRLEPFPAAAVPAVADLVTRVMATGAPPGNVPLLWRPARPVATARADGIVHRYIEVGPSFAGRALTAPAATEAVLGHELAHHAARDVAPSRFAWWSGVALAVAVVPFSAVVWDAGSRRALEALARLLVVLFLVAAARAAVLRARELDADLAARRRSPTGLSEALHPAGPVPAHSERITTILADHPSPQRRLDVVDDPRQACRLGLLDAWLVGLTTAVAAPVITRLVRAWFQFGDPAFYAELFGWAFTGTLLGAWLAAMMLRGVAAGRDAGRPVDLGAFSACLAAALLLGGYVLGTPLLQPLRPLPATITGAGATAVLALGLVAVAVWLRGGVGWWLDAWPAWRWRAAAVLGATVGGAVIGGLVLGLLKHVEGVAANLDDQPLSLGPDVDPDEPLALLRLLLDEAQSPVAGVLAAVAALTPVALALLTRHGSRRESGPPRWLWSLDGGDGDASPPGARRSWAEDPVRWPTALGVGVAAGAAAVACCWLYATAWDPADQAAGGGWWASAQSRFAAEAIVGGVAGAGAAVVALVVRRARAPLAGLAAGVAAVVGAVGAWGVRSADRVGTGSGGLAELVGDVAVVAVVTALVLGALLALLPRPETAVRWRRVAAVALPLAAAALLVGTALRAVDAIAPPARDTAYYRTLLADGLDDRAVTALVACQRGAVTVEQFELLTRRGSTLADPAAAPSGAELRAVHRDLVGAIGTCLSAARAGSGGQIVVPSAAAEVVTDRLSRFATAARGLGLIAG